VAVTVITVAAASEPVFVLTDKFTVGAVSLSVMTIFCEVVAPNAIPADGDCIVNTAVSVPSKRASSITVNVTDPVVDPEGIAIVVLLNVKSPAVIFVPETAKLTVWLPITGAEVVAVTVMTVAAASEPAFVLTDKFTIGVSLSVMTILCEVVAPNAIPADGDCIVNTTVSVPSTRTSSTTVNVTDPVVDPEGIVIVVLLKV
jgi:hypothetical protein